MGDKIGTRPRKAQQKEDNKETQKPTNQ